MQATHIIKGHGHGFGQKLFNIYNALERHFK